MKSIKNFIYFIILFYVVGIINAKSTSKTGNRNSNNKYYIITIKDSSKYSFNIQPTKQDENSEKLLKKNLEEIQKFNDIDLNDVEDIIRSDNCYSEINDKNLNDTTLCKLNTNSVIDNGKIDINELEKKLKPKSSFVSKQMEKIAEIIIDNINTYKEDTVTNELHNEVLKRSSVTIKELLNDEIFSKVLKNTYDILDVTVIYAYLSKEVYEIVKDLPDVVECIEDIKIPFPDVPESLVHIDKPIKYTRDNKTLKNKRNEENIYYNITDIKADTKWSDISIENNAPHHLSLISQSKVDSKLIDKYDTNFYYPSSAGAGVDIYFIDGGINVNHIDFDTTNRTVTCDAIINSNGYKKISKKSKLYKNCYINEDQQQHGISVASAAAGSLYGVAKNANIHALAIEPYISDLISSLKYIDEYATNPHKTVINISLGVYFYSNTLDKLFNIMIKKGFMVVASAGNESTDACITDYRYTNGNFGFVNEKNYPSSFVDVISVGSMDNSVESEEIPINKNVYNSAPFSNYGSCIDIFAPGYAYLASFPKDSKEDKIYTTKEFVCGTSFSSPMVAGVAAVLISENPEITFNQEILRKMLIDLSVKDVLSDLQWLNTPNRLLNIGKIVVYSANDKYNGCGILSGKKSCPDDSCCSIDGYCGMEEQFCEVDCQSEFGNCSPNNHPSPKENNDDESNYKDVWIYNYYMDYCLKFAPGNYLHENLILTVCDEEDTDYYWYINTKGESKVIQNTYEDVCMNFNEEGIAYADPCETGVVIKNIYTTQNKDSIQSDEFPDMCLKPVLSDFNPFGITIFTESTGIRAMMDTCDYENEYQHWRLRDIPEVVRYYDDAIFEEEMNQSEHHEEENITLTYNNYMEKPSETPTNDMEANKDKGNKSNKKEKIKNKKRSNNAIENDDTKEIIKSIIAEDSDIEEKIKSIINEDSDVEEKIKTIINEDSDIEEKIKTIINEDSDVEEKIKTIINEDSEADENLDASNVVEIEENTDIEQITEVETAEPEITPTVSENTEFINGEEILTTSDIYTTITMDIDDEPTYWDDYYSEFNPESYTFVEPEYTENPDPEPEIIYNEYGQVFNRDDYIPCVFNKIVVTNKKKVWIYNAEKKLCLSSPGRYGQQALLEKCDSKNKGQQWLVPDDNYGYYVNKEDNDICIIYTPDKKLIFNGCIEAIPLEMLYIKNHASVIAFEDDTLKIYDELHDEEVCMTIQEDQMKKNEVLLNMVPCDQPHSTFILTTSFPENK